MEHTKITVIYQERHVRLKELISEHIVSANPVLIYSQVATSLQRVTLSNIYIAPDSETVNYLEQVEKLIEEQNQIYYPIYIAVRRYFRQLFNWNQSNEITLEQIK